MGFSGENTRAEERYAVKVNIECAYYADDCEAAKEGPWQTVTNDVSYSGMGFYSECPAQEGQVIKIFLKDVCTDPLLAEVKWCKRQMQDLYRIGIEYIGLPNLNLIPQS
jgi:c-di-GMP-binding flagellar brake protein YcgR